MFGFGCADDGPGPDASDCPIAGNPTLEIGVPDPVTFLDFEPLTSGGDIPLSSNGQTFLAVQLAIRATNLSRFANIDMTVTYSPPGMPVRTAVKDSTQQERLFCFDDPTGTPKLHLVPVVVSSEMLGSDLEIAGQPVDIDITVTDAEARTVSGQASGVLQRI